MCVVRPVVQALLAAVLLAGSAAPASLEPPFLVVLGVAQDAGVPQAGSYAHPAWQDASLQRHATSLGLVGDGGRYWLFEATPDLKQQLYALHALSPDASSAPAGVFLSHAHMGHYAGLLFLGHESMGAEGVPVFVMPRMAGFLESNGPWDQLVRYHNIELRVMTADQAVVLDDGLQVTPFLVPHRQEYTEVAGFRIEGPNHSVLFIPDIDSWAEWDAAGKVLEDEIGRVDRAYLDGTFFEDGEVAGRDMSGFPHPRIRDTVLRLETLPESERNKVRFIHLNHTNPALYPAEAREFVESRGFGIAEEGEIFGL